MAFVDYIWKKEREKQTEKERGRERETTQHILCESPATARALNPKRTVEPYNNLVVVTFMETRQHGNLNWQLVIFQISTI
jgi:hypothetical protein